MRFPSSATPFRLADLFIPEDLRRSVADHRRARSYVTTLLFGPPLALLPWLALGFFEPQTGILYWLTTAGFLVFYACPVALRLTGRFSLVTAVSIIHATFLLFLGVSQYDGVDSPFLLWLGILPLLAAFYVPDQRMRGATLGGIAVLALAFFASQLGGYRLDQHMLGSALDPLGMVTRFCVGIFVWTMSTYYAGVASMQQTALEHEIEGHRDAEVKLRHAMEQAARAHSLEAQLHHSQRLEALGTLAGGIAHEMNNALVPAVALTQIVARKFPEGSRERRNLETVLTGAERSRDLVKRILAVSRAEEQRPRERFDLAVILAETLRMAGASLPAPVRLEQEIPGTAIIEGDPTQLHQVILNLVTNAAQAIGDTAGTIAVRLSPAPGGGWLLSVADTGCGMDEATRARIFEPFFTTKADGRGTGLGLAVVQGVVREHGGDISVESAPGRGSRFDIRLPMRGVEPMSTVADTAAGAVNET
jgi:signal transduction histidine kinase